MKRLNRAIYFFEYLILIGFLIILAFSVYNDGGINILSHLLIAASLLVFGVIYFVRNSKQSEQEYNLKFGSEVIPILFFILFFLISFVFSQTKNVGLLEVILFVSVIFVYLFFSSQKWDLLKFEKFLYGILIIGVIATIYGYFHYILDPFNRFDTTFGISIYKFVGYPNAYANFLLLILPIPFYFLHKKAHLLNKVLLFSSITLMLTAFFLTYSRGALIVLSVIGFLCLLGVLIHSKSKFRQTVEKISLIAVIVAVSALLTIPVNYLRQMNQPDVNSFAEKITLVSGEKDTSTSDRFDFWEASLKLFIDNPVLGTGPGSFQYVFPVYQKSLLGNSNSPHNLFLKLLVENGLFTMISFILFLLILFVRTIQTLKKIPAGERILLFTLSASIFGSLLHNMIDYNLNFVSTILLLFVFMGMIAFIVNKYSNPFISEVKHKLIKIIFVFVGLIMCFVSLHEVYYSYMFMKGRAAYKEGDYSTADMYYEKSLNIYLKRDLYIGYAQMNVKKYETEGDIDSLKKAESLLLTGLSLNIHDAFLVNYLGDIELELNKLTEARNYYAKALKLDPKNNLDYYYDVQNVDEYLTKEEIDQGLRLLEDFQNKLEVNAHLTILTGNPDSAVMIYELLQSKIQNTEFQPVYNEKILKGLRDIKATYDLEKTKFEKYYGIELIKEN